MVIGKVPERAIHEEVTIFDSTGLAISMTWPMGSVVYRKALDLGRWTRLKLL